MSVHVTDFKYEKGKNDAKYIELLEKTLKNEQAITAKAVAKVRELAAANEKLKKECSRDKIIDNFVEKIMEYCSMSDMNRKMIKQIAEQMKKEV